MAGRRMRPGTHSGAMPSKTLHPRSDWEQHALLKVGWHAFSAIWMPGRQRSLTVTNTMSVPCSAASICARDSLAAFCIALTAAPVRRAPIQGQLHSTARRLVQTARLLDAECSAACACGVRNKRVESCICTVPISGLPPAPRPLVSSCPIWILCGVSTGELASACSGRFPGPSKICRGCTHMQAVLTCMHAAGTARRCSGSVHGSIHRRAMEFLLRYLRVRVDDPEFDALQLGERHAVHGIGPAATHAQHLCTPASLNLRPPAGL